MQEAAVTSTPRYQVMECSWWKIILLFKNISATVHRQTLMESLPL